MLSTKEFPFCSCQCWGRETRSGRSSGVGKGSKRGVLFKIMGNCQLSILIRHPLPVNFAKILQRLKDIHLQRHVCWSNPRRHRMRNYQLGPYRAINAYWHERTIARSLLCCTWGKDGACALEPATGKFVHAPAYTEDNFQVIEWVIAIPLYEMEYR